MILSAGQLWRCRHRERTCGHGRCRKEKVAERRRYSETHTLPHVKQADSGGLQCDSGSSHQRSVTTQGWGGREAGGRREGGTRVAYGRFVLIFGRNQHSTVKQLSSN